MRSTKWAGFRSILCPVDFSEHSQLALQYAVAIAARNRAALRVVYVNDPVLVAAASAALHDQHFVKRSARELQEFIDRTVPPKERPHMPLTSHVSLGPPADQILKASKQRRTDLIVLGTHGLTGVDRLIVGSTTLSVLQRTTVPTLAVPRSREAPASGVTPSWPGEHVLAAVEFGEGLSREVDNAARIAQWFGSSLLLAHVLPTISAPAWLSADLSAQERIRIGGVQRKMDALAATAQRYAKTDVRVVCGNIADEIAVLAASERAELLVTALHDRRHWFGAKRGSISYHVLSQAIVPVLALPPQWRAR